MSTGNVVRFVGKATLISVAAYLISGGLAYLLLTKRFYVGDHAVFAAFLRSEANPEQWAHVTRWQVPILLARALLIAIVLLPFREALSAHAPRRRLAVLFGVFFVMLHLAAAAPSPSNLEGLVYMRPELLGVDVFLLTQPEMIAQCLLMAIGIGLWACRPTTPSQRLPP
ncbi:MAG: hypothetical protein IPJ65_14775 [Archangiaceae bacterium]|nr:hypothetical protein [Archangiaceae bacterium]